MRWRGGCPSGDKEPRDKLMPTTDSLGERGIQLPLSRVRLHVSLRWMTRLSLTKAAVLHVHKQENSSHPAIPDCGQRAARSQGQQGLRIPPSSAFMTNTSSGSVAVKCHLLPNKPGAVPLPAHPVTHTSLAAYNMPLPQHSEAHLRKCEIHVDN